MTDNIKTQLDEPVLRPEIFLEISPNEIGSYKINNLSKKFMEFDVPRKEAEKEDERAVMLTRMMMGML